MSSIDVEELWAPPRSAICGAGTHTKMWIKCLGRWRFTSCVTHVTVKRQATLRWPSGNFVMACIGLLNGRELSSPSTPTAIGSQALLSKFGKILVFVLGDNICVGQ